MFWLSVTPPPGFINRFAGVTFSVPASESKVIVAVVNFPLAQKLAPLSTTVDEPL